MEDEQIHAVGEEEAVAAEAAAVGVAEELSAAGEATQRQIMGAPAMMVCVFHEDERVWD